MIVKSSKWAIDGYQYLAPSTFPENVMSYSRFLMRTVQRHAITTMVCLVTLGCGGDSARVALSGSVSLDGAPVARGSIRFTPSTGTSGNAALGTISEGKFAIPSATGIVPGLYDVVVSTQGARIESKPMPGEQSSGSATGERRFRLSLDIAALEPGQLEIKCNAQNELDQ